MTTKIFNAKKYVLLERVKRKYLLQLDECHRQAIKTQQLREYNNMNLGFNSIRLKNIMSFITDLSNNRKLYSTISYAQELAIILAEAKDQPNFWKSTKAVINAAIMTMDNMKVFSDEFFEDDRWIHFPLFQVEKAVYDIVKTLPCKSIKTADKENVIIKLVELTPGGPMMAWVETNVTNHVKNSDCPSIYCENTRVEETKQLISMYLWETYKCDSIVFESITKMNNLDSQSFKIKHDNINNPLPSQRATDLAAFFKKTSDAGVPRSLFMYGPPGTGKSTIARMIAKELGMRTCRFLARDIMNCPISFIQDMVTAFKPGVIIIDDVDRCSDSLSLLEIIPQLKTLVPIVIATANNLNALDEATLRPGRFDMWEEIVILDEHVMKNLLTEEFAHLYDHVKKWPIAYIEELKTRCKFMTHEEAFSSIIELRNRAKRSKTYVKNDENEDNEEQNDLF